MPKLEGFYIYCAKQQDGSIAIATSAGKPIKSSRKAETTFTADAYDTIDDFDPNEPLGDGEGDPLQNHVEWLARKAFKKGVEYGRKHLKSRVFTT